MPGVVRTIRRCGEQSVAIAVSVRGRPWAAVTADMVEGVIVANALTGIEAQRVRRDLWEQLGAELLVA